MALVLGVWTFLRVLLDSSASAVVTLENVALRHQLAVLQRSDGRPWLRGRDRLFWSGYHSCGQGGGSAFSLSNPRPSSPGHQEGFQLYWRWKLSLAKTPSAPNGLISRL